MAKRKKKKPMTGNGPFCTFWRGLNELGLVCDDSSAAECRGPPSTIATQHILPRPDAKGGHPVLPLRSVKHKLHYVLCAYK